jgi:hypothetical protein
MAIGPTRFGLRAATARRIRSAIRRFKLEWSALDTRLALAGCRGERPLSRGEPWDGLAARRISRFDGKEFARSHCGALAARCRSPAGDAGGDATLRVPSRSRRMAAADPEADLCMVGLPLPWSQVRVAELVQSRYRMGRQPRPNRRASIVFCFVVSGNRPFSLTPLYQLARRVRLLKPMVVGSLSRVGQQPRQLFMIAKPLPATSTTTPMTINKGAFRGNCELRNWCTLRWQTRVRPRCGGGRLACKCAKYPKRACGPPLAQGPGTVASGLSDRNRHAAPSVVADRRPVHAQSAGEFGFAYRLAHDQPPCVCT